MLGKLIALVVVSAVLTGAVRHYALRQNIIAIPNERSSHEVPTPSGGGLAFVVLFLLATLWLNVERTTTIALIGGGSLIALIGWIDDRVNLSFRLRLGVQALAACWALAWLGGLPQIELGSTTLVLGWLGWPIGIVAIVWLINLYNFMDGIDGLAGGQAVTTAITAGALLYFSGGTALGELTWILAAVVFGFLLWNWDPAKIFMGDVASGFLGYTFAVLAIASESQGGPPILIWMLLLAVFIVDATATVIRRVLNGEKWYDAHRSHAYQRAMDMGFSHRRVTAMILGINVCLGIIAWIAFRCGQLMLPLAGVAFLGLLGLWWYVVSKERKWRAGRVEVG